MNNKHLSGKKLDIALEYHNSQLIYLIACILAEEIHFEIGHFHNFQTSMTLTLDWVMWHTIV